MNGEPLDLRPAASIPRRVFKKKDGDEKTDAGGDDEVPKKNFGLLSEEAAEMLKSIKTDQFMTADGKPLI